MPFVPVLDVHDAQGVGLGKDLAVLQVPGKRNEKTREVVTSSE